MIPWFLCIRNLGGVELNGSGYFQSFIKISIKLSRAAVIWRLHWGWRISFQGGILIGHIGWFWLLDSVATCVPFHWAAWLSLQHGRYISQNRWSGKRMVKVSLWLIIRSYFCHILFIRSKLLSLAHSPG